jgi:predicted aspartyl protease
MGRIVTPVSIANALDAAKRIECEALVDTGSAGLVLPLAWKDRLGDFPMVRTVEMEMANQQPVVGEVCGPARIQIEGFDAIANEVIFLEMTPQNGHYEPLVGYIILEQSRAAVDLVTHRLIHVKRFDLKATSRALAPPHFV